MLKIDKCKTCINFLSFKDYPSLYQGEHDGMCIIEADDSSKWQRKNATDTCLHHVDKAGHQVIEQGKSEIRQQEFTEMAEQIKQIAETPTALITNNQPQGKCMDCIQWIRNSNETGVCTQRGKLETNQNHTCEQFRQAIRQTSIPAKPQVAEGEKLEVLPMSPMYFVGSTSQIIICRDDQGKEHAFDKQTCRFMKCNA